MRTSTAPVRQVPSSAAWYAKVHDLFFGDGLWGGGVLLFIWLLALFGIAARCLPLPQIGFAQDVGVMLDAGWRYYQGLRTHADYHSPLGPMFALIFGMPMKLGGPAYDSLTLLPPVVTTIFTIWTICVSRPAMPALVCAALAAAIGAAAGGIFHLGFPIEALSFAVFYNRIGFGLLCIIGLAALLPRGPGVSTSTAAARDASIAVSLAMLFFLKVNFFFAAAPFCLCSIILYKRGRTERLAFAISSVAVCWFFLHEIGYRVDRMIFDLQMAANARRACLDSFFFPIRNAWANYDFGMLLVLQTVATLPVVVTGRHVGLNPMAYLGALWGPAVLGYALTLMQSHGDGRGIPLVLVGMAVAMTWLPTRSTSCPSGDGRSVPAPETAAEGPAKRMAAACVFCAAALFVIPHAYSYSVWAAVSRNPGPRQFHAKAIRNLYIGSFGNNLGADAVGKMNDAHEVLARHTRPGDSMQYMDMNNIYTYAQQLRSPLRSMLFWDNRSSYTAACHPPFSDFDDTDFILVPKQPLTLAPLETEWWKLYAEAIESHYDLVDETSFFKLWKRAGKESSRR